MNLDCRSYYICYMNNKRPYLQANNTVPGGKFDIRVNILALRVALFADTLVLTTFDFDYSSV